MSGRLLRALFATAACGAIGLACTLVTDLDGLAGPADDPLSAPDRGTLPDGRSLDAPPGADDGSTTVAVGSDARWTRTLTLTNGAGVTIPALYTFCTAIPAETVADAIAAEKMRSDLADVFVFDGSTAIEAIFDHLAGTRESVCFKLSRSIAAGASDTYELRYGDPNLVRPAVMNRAGFFAFYEAFDAPLSSKWLVYGNPVVDAGVLVMPAGAAHGITTTAATDGVPGEASLEMRVAVTRPDSDPVPYDGGPFYYWLGFQHEGDFAANRPWSLFVARGKSTIQAEHETTSGICSSGCGSGSTLQSTESRIYRVDRWSGGVRFILDDGTSFDAAGSSGDLSIMIRSFLAQSDVVVSWVRARPIVWPEPAVVIGPEKSL